MSGHTQRLAIFPGTFDPITNGHVDVIERGSHLFDELIVAVGENPEKQSLMDQSQRVAVIREIAAPWPNVRVEPFTGLTVHFARSVGAHAILRGIRNTTDLHFEFQLALTNRVVAGVETVFVMTNPQLAFTSSSLIKQIARMGGDVSALVPPQVYEALRKLGRSGATDSDLVESP